MISGAQQVPIELKSSAENSSSSFTVLNRIRHFTVYIINMIVLTRTDYFCDSFHSSAFFNFHRSAHGI
jgi:hypothetical protein